MEDTATKIDLMAQVFTDEWIEETIRIEDEVNCTIGAGPELGANGGAYLSFVSNYGNGIDPERLKDFLRQELLRFPCFDEADVEEIAAATLRRAGDRLQQKFVPKKKRAEAAHHQVRIR